MQLVKSMYVVFKQRNSNGLHLRGSYSSTRATAAAPHFQRPIRVSSRVRKVITMSDAREQREAAAELHPGDHVEWGAPIPGKRKTSGEVVEVVTEDTTIGKNHFKASEDNPKVRVKSSKTGKEAVHKPASVRKVEDDPDDDEDEEVDEEEEEEN